MGAGSSDVVLSGTRAQSPTAGEYQIKAAFLFNFAKFVEWPSSSFPDASAPLRICIFGRDPFGEELRNIPKKRQSTDANSKSINGRSAGGQNLPDPVHQFIRKGANEGHLDRLCREQRTDGCGDEGFAEQGGMINFVVEKSRVQFEVNRKAAEQAGLKISSKLLSVAKVVLA